MEVIFEFTQIGPIVKVTAIDVETGKEVVIQGPANAGQATLQKTAYDKLRYVLQRDKGK